MKNRGFRLREAIRRSGMTQLEVASKTIQNLDEAGRDGLQRMVAVFMEMQEKSKGKQKSLPPGN